MKKTVKRIVSLVCMLCLLCSIWLPLLPASPAERTSAAPASVSDEITVTDGSRFIVTVSYDTDAGIPEGAALSVRELTEADEGYGDYLARSAEALGAEEESIQFARALDISLYDPATGEEYQPTGSISVSITMPDTALEESGSVSVVHFGEEAQVLPAEVSENAVAFETEGFSVYVVIAHEGDNLVEEPRVEFHFLDYTYYDKSSGVVTVDGVSRDYSALQEGDYESGEFSFINKGLSFQTNQILKDSETLEKMSNPPNVEKTDSIKYFFGWYLVEKSTTTPVAEGDTVYRWTEDPQLITFDQLLRITYSDGTLLQDGSEPLHVGDTIRWELAGVSGTATLDREGIAHVYLAPVYDDYYFIVFHLGAKDDTELASSILHRKLAVLGSDEQVTVRIGDVKAPSKQAESFVFSGWETINADKTRKTFYDTLNDDGIENDMNAPAGKTGYYKTFQKGDFSLGEARSVDLYPVFDEARWIRFYTGKSGNGASYVGSVFRLTNDLNTGTYYTDLPVSDREGYALEGWYAFAVVDSDGNITNLNTEKPVKYYYYDAAGVRQEKTVNRKALKITEGTGAVCSGLDEKEGSLQLFKSVHDSALNKERLYLYKNLTSLDLTANWVAKNVEYTVLYWLESPNDDGYSFMDSMTMEGIAGEKTAASFLSATDPIYTGNKLQYAEPSPDQNKSTAGNQEDILQKDIAGDGSTIVNVYYDRKRYTLRFDVGFSFSSSSGAIPCYDELTPAAATAYDGTVYGVDGFNMVELTPDGSGGWTYPSTKTVRHDYTGEYRYKETSGTGGVQFGIVSGEIVELTESVSYSRTNNIQLTGTPNSNTGTQYGIVDGNIQQVYLNNNAWRTTNSRNGPVYNGTRFTGDRNGTTGANYEGDIYYFNGSSFVSSGSGTLFGVDSSGKYFQLNQSVGYTYDNGTVYPSSGKRYLRVSSDSDDVSFIQGFVDGAMRDLEQDDDGWYYETQEPIVLPYTGKFFKEGTISGVTYCVSGINDATNYNDYLSTNTNDRAQDIQRAFFPSEYSGTRTETKSGTTFTVYYFDITAKYGADLSKVWPSKQSTKNGYDFIGWLSKPQSKYYEEVSHSTIKGLYETMDETVICLNSPNYTATSAENGGIAHEFRSRYRPSANIKKYVYRIFFQNYDLPGETPADKYPAKANIELEINSEGDPQYRTVFSYTGYKTGASNITIKYVDSDGKEHDIPNGTPYSSYPVDSVGYDAMIITYKYQALPYTIRFQYTDNSLFPNGEKTYYFGQSLKNAGSDMTTYATENAPEGHKFVGWYDNQSCAGAPFNFKVKMPNHNILLYAKFEPVEYDVRIDPNGGEFDHISHEYDNNSDDPSKRGYQGWWWNGDGEAVKYEKLTSTEGCTPFLTFNRETLYKKDGNGQFILDDDGNKIIERQGDSGYVKPVTYRNQEHGQALRQYQVERKYVPISDAAAQAYARDGGQIYYYLNTHRRDEDGSGIPTDLRNALYLTEDEIAEYYAFYLNWFRANLIGGYIDDWLEPLSFGAWKDEYVSPQKYRTTFEGETYSLVGWYKVEYDENGNETGLSQMPYNFDDPVKGDFTIRAVWRLDSGYYIEYIPRYVCGDGTVINGNLVQWQDPATEGAKYADGANTQTLQQPVGITANNNAELGKEYIFHGWILANKKVVNNVPTYTIIGDQYHDPGEPITVSAADADKDGVIYYQAVYHHVSNAIRRPSVTTLKLDANTGFLTPDGTTNPGSGSLSLDWNNTGTIDFNYDDNVETVTFGHFSDGRMDHIQADDTIHLYRYATNIRYPGGVTPYLDTAGETEDESQLLDPVGKNYFAHPDRHLLLGFDVLPNEKDFIATYPADSVVSLQRMQEDTIYAVWEPMVYLNIVNDTEDTANGVSGGTIKISLSSPEGETLYVVNEKKGLYVREPIDDLHDIPVEKGETLRLAIPYGENKKVAVSGTNELGTGILLLWQGELNGDTSNHCSGEKENGSDFCAEETLVKDETGITITFRALKAEYTLVTDDNWAEGKRAEFYFTDEPSDHNYVENAFELSLPSTRMGYRFLGWAKSEADAVNKNVLFQAPTVDNPDTLKLDNVKNRIYNATLDPDGDHVVVLYAVWEGLSEANTVYVFKSVPSPGNTEKDFTFRLQSSITFTPNSGSDISWDTGSGNNTVFTLKNNQCLKIHTDVNSMDGNTEMAYIRITVTKHSVDLENSASQIGVQIGSAVELYQEWTNHNHQAGSFKDFSMSVTEDSYAMDHYETTMELTGITGGAGFGLDDSQRKISWLNYTDGGAVVYTNQRETTTVTVKKELLGAGGRALFNFDASYTSEGEFVKLDEFTVDSESSSGTVLYTIPVGAQMTLREFGSDLKNYWTTAKLGNAAMTVERSSATVEGVTTYYRTVGFVVESQSVVTYTNELKSLPVKILKLGSDGTNIYTDVEASFDLADGDMANVFTGRLTDDVASGTRGNVIFETGTAYRVGAAADPNLCIGEYTLKETKLWGDYMKLSDEFGISVVGLDNADDGVQLAVTGKGAVVEKEGDVWVVTVTNRKKADITVRVGLLDPMVTQREFWFSGSYRLDGQSYTIEPFSLTGYATTDGLPDEDIETSRKVLSIPIGAQDLSIRENTSQAIGSEGETIASTYTTMVRNEEGDGTWEKKAEYTYTSIDYDNDDEVITFTNRKNTVNITVRKRVALTDKSGKFSFTATLQKSDGTPVKGYPIYINGTPETDSDDVLTDIDNGTYQFVLMDHDHATGEYVERVLTVPVGAKLKIEETGVSDTTDSLVLADFITTISLDNAIPEGSYTFENRLFSMNVPSASFVVTFVNDSAGVDVKFLKTDGFGNALGGARFTLYEADNVTEIDTQESADGTGVVHFEKVRSGVHYLRETTGPTDSDEVKWSNSCTYILLVGDAALRKDDSALDAAAKAYLSEISGIAPGSPGDIGAQTALYKEEYGDGFDKYAIFQIDSATNKAVTNPDIAAFGILNEAEATRRVLLRKTGKKSESSFEVLKGAHFRIFRPDLSEVTQGQEPGKTYYESLSSGVWFTDALPYGKYYLVETAAPLGYSGNAGKVFVLVVTESGFFDGKGNAVKQLDVNSGEDQPSYSGGASEEDIIAAFMKWRKDQVTD